MGKRETNIRAHKAVIWQLIAAFLFVNPTLFFGQNEDSVRIANVEFITDQLENIAQTTDLNLDYSDLIDDYLFYYQNPINLNSSDIEQLVELHLLNDIQLNNLRSYISRFGQLYSVFEIKNIPGFDAQTIQNIRPFIKVTDVRVRQKIRPNQIFKYGKHQLILRYSQVVEPSVGFTLPVDSASERPGSTYLGSAQALYLRYAFRYKQKLRFGFTLDKDAGEFFTQNQLGDSVKQILKGKSNYIIDFFSAHVYAADIGILKKIVIGDYHLEFGQGLTMWSGLAFGKSAEAVKVKRFGRGIRPNTSANENRFFRGAAATLGWKGFAITGFYSYNAIDANLTSNNLIDEESISSILETGKHRTINELLAKNAIHITAFGGRASYNYKFLKVGVTTFQTRLSAQMQVDDQLYKQFYFSGNKLSNFGFDLSLSFNKFNFFGEVSGSNPGGLAGLGGINAYLSDRFVFTILYHDYSKDYHNLFTNPFAVSSSIANEQGLYIGFRALLHKNLSLNGYADHFRFPWLRYRTDSPNSIGKDYLLQLNIIISRNVDMYFRYRYRLKQENYSDEYDYTPSTIDIQRNEFRYFISYKIFESLIFKNRIDYVLFSDEKGENERGYLMYQDILYRPVHFPLEVTFRYALFDTRGYDSRIYTYENDVLYAFSVPSYFDKGQRIYLMLRYRAMKQLDIWVRIARTVYSNKLSIGSGADEIDGNTKTEIKVQIMLKL